MRANLIGKLNSKTTHFDSESDENNISDSRLGPDYADSNSIIKRYKMPINYAVCAEPDGTKPIEAANVQQPLFFYKKKPSKMHSRHGRSEGTDGTHPRRRTTHADG